MGVSVGCCPVEDIMQNGEGDIGGMSAADMPDAGGESSFADCASADGQCIDVDFMTCDGQLLVGLCPGGSNIVCCTGEVGG